VLLYELHAERRGYMGWVVCQAASPFMCPLLGPRGPGERLGRVGCMWLKCHLLIGTGPTMQKPEDGFAKEDLGGNFIGRKFNIFFEKF